MISRIALALTIAAISTGAAAQSSRKQPTWDDLLKPLDVKTNPNVPIAPPSPAVPLDQMPPQAQSSESALLDGCVISAIGRLPKVDGLRVLKTSYAFLRSVRMPAFDFWMISVSVDLNGRHASYQWQCRIYEGTSATLVAG